MATRSRSSRRSRSRTGGAARAASRARAAGRARAMTAKKAAARGASRAASASAKAAKSAKHTRARLCAPSVCSSVHRSERVVPQERRSECADGPVPGLCFLDANHRHSVRRPRSVYFCRRCFALMVARQAVWRESAHWDASHKRRADTDAAAVVRGCLLSSAAACVLGSIAHFRRNVTYNWLVGDVSEIARMNGTAYPLPCLI